QTRMAHLRSECADIDAEYAAVEEQVRQLAAERAVVASTLSLLLDLQRQLAGYEQGARDILLAKQGDPSRFPGIRYPVGEVIRVAAEYRPAIEAALGRRVFALIAATVDGVKDGRTYLLGNGQGGASFLPVDLSRAAPTAPDRSSAGRTRSRPCRAGWRPSIPPRRKPNRAGVPWRVTASNSPRRSPRPRRTWPLCRLPRPSSRWRRGWSTPSSRRFRCSNETLTPNERRPPPSAPRWQRKPA